MLWGVYSGAMSLRTMLGGYVLGGHAPGAMFWGGHALGICVGRTLRGHVLGASSRAILWAYPSGHA